MLRWGGLAVLLAIVFACVSCAPSAVPSRQATVKIGVIPCLTGGGATADQHHFMAFGDYVKYFNEEVGIPGVRVELDWRDNQTDIPMFVSAYRAMVDRGTPLIFSNYVTALEGIVTRFEKDRVPVVTSEPTATMISPPGWVFGISPTQGESATVVLDYFLKGWTKEQRPRLQFLVLDTMYGKRTAEEAGPYAEQIGYEVLPLETCHYVVLDAMPQLLRIRERHPDLVYIQHIQTGAWPIMRDVERLGLQDVMQFAGNAYILEAPLIEFAPSGSQGFMAAKSTPWFSETEIPGIRTLVAKQMEYHGQLRQLHGVIDGWVCAAVVCEAVRIAIKDVGIENIDGPAMKRALESMQQFDVQGMVQVSFGPADRRGNTSLMVYRVDGNDIVRVSDRLEAHLLS